ncbi:MAG: GxxExxY protein [Anaerolineae bacterium]|nr:GxxExxY protein [Anaerolineae bacterium]
MPEIIFKELSYAIVGACMEVHKTLGSAFLEIVYESALALELAHRGIAFERQKRLPVFYLGEQVGEFKADFVIEGNIILELKAVRELNEIHEAQAHNYLAASGLKLAIIINFGSPSLEFKRIVK